VRDLISSKGFYFSFEKRAMKVSDISEGGELGMSRRCYLSNYVTIDFTS
jgi:hypothetical protein